MTMPRPLRCIFALLLAMPLLAGPAVAQSTKGRLVTTGAAPAISTCGTGTPTIVGNDNSGVITIGTGTPSACTLTFAVAFANTPTCYFNDKTTAGKTNAGALYKVVESTTAVTVTFQAATVNGDDITYFCLGR